MKISEEEIAARLIELERERNRMHRTIYNSKRRLKQLSDRKKMIVAGEDVRAVYPRGRPKTGEKRPESFEAAYSAKWRANNLELFRARNREYVKEFYWRKKIVDVIRQKIVGANAST